MLPQVWLNILGNAIKFSKDGGEVRIYCAKHGSSVRVEIEDYGVGMSEETRQHACEQVLSQVGRQPRHRRKRAGAEHCKAHS